MNINTPDISPFITTDQGLELRTTVIDIGAWNMLGNIETIVATGLPATAILINYRVWIGTDIEIAIPAYVKDLNWIDATIGHVNGGLDLWAGNFLALRRLQGGAWDNANYQNGILNRGIIILQYYLP